MSTTSKKVPTVPDNALGLDQLKKDKFFQVPKVFVETERYRTKLNSDAKLLYGLIKDRFMLSLNTIEEEIEEGFEDEELSYVDENGKVFCILDNREIQFALNLSSGSAKKAVKLLKEAGLLFTQPVSGGANRLYLLDLDVSDHSFAKYKADMEWFKHLESRKDKKKNEPKKDYAKILAKWEKKYGSKKKKKKSAPNKEGKPKQSDEQGEAPNKQDEGGSEESKRGSKFNPLGSQNNDHLEGANNDHPDGSKNDRPGEQNMTPNNTYSSKPEPSDTYVSDTEPSLHYSSSRDKTYPQGGDNSTQKELEEEQRNESTELSRNTLVTQESGYSVLKGLQLLKDEGICITPKDFNVLCKTLKEEQVPSFELWLVSQHIGTHHARVAERENTADAVDYEPAFFAYGLADAVRKEIRKQIGLAKRAARKKKTVEYKPLPLYDWVNGQQG